MPAGGASVGTIYAEAELDISKFERAAGKLTALSASMAGALRAVSPGVEAAQLGLDGLGADIAALAEALRGGGVSVLAALTGLGPRLRESGAAATAGLAEGFSGLEAELGGLGVMLRAAGVQAARAASTGLTIGAADVGSAARAAGQATLAAMGAGMRPEGFMALGLGVAQGMASGLSGSDAPRAAAAGVSAGALSALAGGASGAGGIGRSFSAGLAAGIRSGRSGVIAAAVSVAQAAVSAARAALAIHSPSRVTEGMGEAFDLGFARGVKGGMPEIRRAIEAAVYVRPPRMAEAAAPVEKGGARALVIDYEALAAAMDRRRQVINLDGREIARLNAENTARAQNARARNIALRRGTR